MVKAYAVFDVKAACYGRPMFMSSKGLAIRGFSDACVQKDSPMAMHPADYSLYEIGEYEPNSGKLTGVNEPVFVCSAAEMIEPKINVKESVESVAHLLPEK